MKKSVSFKLDPIVVDEIAAYRRFGRQFTSQAHFVECAVDHYITYLLSQQPTTPAGEGER